MHDLNGLDLQGDTKTERYAHGPHLYGRPIGDVNWGRGPFAKGRGGPKSWPLFYSSNKHALLVGLAKEYKHTIKNKDFRMYTSGPLRTHENLYSGITF
jgi:hypothetical protein